VDDLYEVKMKKLKEELQNISIINFTTDIWSDSTMISYKVITAHYLQDDFQLKSTILDFDAFRGRHTGIYIISTFIYFSIKKY